MLEGRSAELERIESLLAAARDGAGAALLLHGEAGIGKTALLREAERLAAGFEQIRTAGFEAQTAIPFAALRRLLEPLLGELKLLPPVQAQALAGALGLEAAPPQAPVAVPMAVLGLLRSAAERRPLLAVVDDLQWLDPGSREAILFAARRLRGSALAVLLASRDGEGAAAERLGLESLPVGPLAPADAGRLLGRAAPGLAAPVRAAVAAASAGNPLALTELPATLSAEQRAGEAPLQSPPRPGPLLESAFARRLAGLDPAARQAVTVAAAIESGPLAWLLAALERRGLDAAALDEPERAGLLVAREGTIALSHPLLRAAAYHGADPGERRGAHRDLAATAPDPARAAWHLAAAASEADAGIAAALDRAAELAVAVGGHLEAGAAFARAAELSPERTARGGRELEAARHLAIGGEFERAQALLDTATGHVGEERRPELEGLRGNLAMRRGDPNGAYRALMAAGERCLAEGRAADAAALFLEATVAPMVTGDLGQQDRALTRARAAAEIAGGSAEVLAELVHGEMQVMRGADARGGAALSGAIGRLGEVDLVAHSEIVGMAAQTLVWAGRFGDGAAVLDAQLGEYRRARALGRLPYPLAVRSQLAFRTGRWDDAGRDGEEAVQLARDSGQDNVLAFALAGQARLRAARGQLEAARAGVAESLGIAVRERADGVAVHAHAAAAFAELLAGDAEAAAAAAERARAIEAAAGLRQPAAAMWAGDLLEALVAAGREGEAAELLTALVAQADGESAWVTMLAARGAAMRAGATEIEAAAAAARAAHERLDLPFERARTELAVGERLRRLGHAGATAALATALSCFERLGAEPLASRARRSLEPAGAPADGALPALATPERRLVELVAAGLTNREIAAELRLGQKTLERRLTALYRKLGVSSRTELLARVGEG